MNDPNKEIQTAYPGLSNWYGVLSGLVFSASFAICGLFSGILADRYNRSAIIALSCILWSLCTLLSGLIDSFRMLFVLRFLLGFFQSAFTPSAYSLLADYFHPNYRTTANSIMNCGLYIGNATSSLTIMIINQYGWRVAYSIIGIMGIIVGILAFIIIKEPQRNQFDGQNSKT